MKKMKLGSLITGLTGLAALLVVASSPAQAAFVVGGENGWQFSYDGMINVFAVYTMQGTVTGHNGAFRPNTADQSFRVRTGLLPNIFGFNIKSPTINGIDYGARLALDPQVNNTATRTGFGPDTLASSNRGNRLDVREVFGTADGCFGQVLAGRALNLFEGRNILTDMTLSGVGVPGDLTGGGTTLGRIGYGYTYPAFGAQFRYTTPDFKGFKWALEIGDPSQINGPAGTTSTVNQPRFETEFSYVTSFPNGKLQAWVSALYQEAKFGPDTATGVAGTNHKVASIGGAGGAQVVYGPVDVVLSGFGGKGLGLTLTQDGGDALDNVGKERTSFGGLAQVQYTIGKVRLGAQYGINYADRTDNDALLAAGGDTSIVKSQQAATGGVYYSLNKYVQLVGEYTWARTSVYAFGAKQDKNVISLGTIFVW